MRVAPMRVAPMRAACLRRAVRDESGGASLSVEAWLKWTSAWTSIRRRPDGGGGGGAIGVCIADSADGVTLLAK